MPWWSSGDSRRTTALVAALLVGSAVLGVGVGAVLAAAGGDGTGDTAEPTTSATPPSPTPSATTRPTRSSSEIEPGTTSDIGYFLATRDKADGTHATFDRVLLLSGKQASDYAKAHHEKKPKKDGLLLVNDNDLTRDLVLADDVTVVGTQQLAGSATPRPVTVQTLLDTVASQGADLLLDLTYDKLGYVTRVREHDLP